MNIIPSPQINLWFLKMSLSIYLPRKSFKCILNSKPFKRISFLTGREQKHQLLILGLLLTLDQRVLVPNDDDIVSSLVGLGGSTTRGRDLALVQGVYSRPLPNSKHSPWGDGSLTTQSHSNHMEIIFHLLVFTVTLR